MTPENTLGGCFSNCLFLFLGFLRLTDLDHSLTIGFRHSGGRFLLAKKRHLPCLGRALAAEKGFAFSEFSTPTRGTHGG